MSKRFVISIILGLLATALCAVRGGFADEPMVAIQGSHLPEVDPSGPQAPKDLQLHLEISFALRNKAEREQFTRDLQNPASPQYHHWLTPKETHERFGESGAEFRAVRDWVIGQGFTVTEESYGRAIDWIRFTGTVAQADRAFGTRIVAVNSDKYANATDILIPQRFKDIIADVVGLDNMGAIATPMPPAHVSPTLAQRSHQLSLELASLRGAPRPTPEITLGGTTAFGPDDLYNFYGEGQLLDVGLNGSGTDCIGIIALSDFSDAAVTSFDGTFALPAPNPNPIPRVLGDLHNPGFLFKLETEALLDIEWAHTAAPGAPLRVYLGNAFDTGNGNQAFADALAKAVNDNSCGALSISLVGCGYTSSFVLNSLTPRYATALMNGQTVFVATGDFGSAAPIQVGNTCVASTIQGVSEFATDVNVTAVGGTQFTPTYINGVDFGFVPESVWQEGSGASGGGPSAIFSQPSWQKGLGVPIGGNRDIPDVALLASPDKPGAFWVDDPSNTGTGAVLSCCMAGTSLGTPIWAGISKLVSQKIGTRLANINPAIYQLGSVGSTIGFRDVVLGNNGFNGVPGFNAGIGYDQATGWGTPDIPTFVNNPMFVSSLFLYCGGCTDNACAMGNATNECSLYTLSGGSFATTGSMTFPRGFFPAVLLANGTTLVAGGETTGGTSIANAEIYSPATRSFTSAPNMNKQRSHHTATRLYDGRVLITGGVSFQGAILSSGEIYNPATGAFTLVSNNMSSARYNHSATLLNDGRVLLAGGNNGTAAAGPLIAVSGSDIFDPIANSFSAVGAMTTPRVGHSAVLLPGGKVLITGGNGTTCATKSSAELFDPSTNSFTAIANMTHARSAHSSTLLPNGKVLIAGGSVLTSGCGIIPQKGAELYDPAAGTFTALSSMKFARFAHSASVLHDGTVLLAGGFSNCTGTCAGVLSAEIFNPSSNTFTQTGNLPLGAGGSGALPTQ